MTTRRILVTAGAIAVASLVASRADADEGLRVSIDWGKLADVLRDGGSLLPRESPSLSLDHPARSGSSHLRWLGASPRFSVIARDWGGVQLLFGHLTLTDQVRLSRSSRMVLSRVRLADGRVTPFVQAGFGQWRVDTDWVLLPRDVEFAGQAGGGFELAINSRAALALEADYTFLYREQREPQMISGPHLWGTFLAARVLF
jgi:hypothetical protein